MIKRGSWTAGIVLIMAGGIVLGFGPQAIAEKNSEGGSLLDLLKEEDGEENKEEQGGSLLDLLKEEDGEEKKEQQQGGSLLDLLKEEDGEEQKEKLPAAKAEAAQEAVSLEGRFPSSATCRSCHPTQYRQWAVSQHAYAQLSPVFNTMQAAVLVVTNGTNGDFCIRCHNPVGMNLGEPLNLTNLKRHPTSREGITCVVCHRLSKPYGIVSGRLAIVEGSIFAPVYGPTGNKELNRVIESKDYVVNADASKKGRDIHADAIKLDQISTSGLCATCHDVRLVNGFRLEDAFSEFKSSPAAKRGVSCQDCHMGRIPGVPSGYVQGPAAVIGNLPTRTRKLTDHRFPGPDYSVIHPGMFPHNDKAAKMATLAEWLTYDYEAGWGTPAFERNVPRGANFPRRWRFRPVRVRARDILKEQFASLKEMNDLRKQILRVAYKLGEVRIDEANEDDGITFSVQVSSGTDGHGVPTGFDAERLVFLQVRVTDAAGRQIFISGDRDPNGDLRDAHSLYVHNGELPLDEYLFNLQSKFLTRNLRGGEREQVLPLNLSLDPLLFLRPDTRATTIYGRPRGVRKHKQILPPLGERWATYEVDEDFMTGKPPYKANIKLIAQMIPINLLHAIKALGFDYGMSPRKIADRVLNGLDPERGLEGAQVLWERDVILKEGAVSRP